MGPNALLEYLLLGSAVAFTVAAAALAYRTARQPRRAGVWMSLAAAALLVAFQCVLRIEQAATAAPPAEPDLVGAGLLLGIAVLILTSSIFGRRAVARALNAQSALRDREALLETIARVVPIGIFMTDENLQPIYVNERWREICGRREQDLAKMDWREFVHPDDLESLQKAGKRSRETGAQMTHRHRIVRDDGSVVWVLLQRQKIVGHSGVSEGYVGALTDITRDMELEDSLIEAQKMEVVGRLTSGITHEMGNLLTILHSNIELLHQRMGHTGSATALLEKIEDALEDGDALVRQIMILSRQQRLDPQAIELNDLVADVINLLRQTVGRAYIIESRIDDGVWPVLADRHHLRAALFNLALNARDASPDGGTIRIIASNAPDDSDADTDSRADDMVVISVVDSGRGIAEEDVARVFEPFFTTKAPGKATGMGLSVVYAFARQSGGSVTVVNNPDRGATVSIQLPRAPSERSGQVPGSFQGFAQSA